MDIIRQLRALIRNPMLLGQASIANLLEQKLELLLPKNAHELCSNRLGLSLTKVWSFENRFVSQFESRQELIDAIIAGCFIPGWSGSFKVPEFRGEACIDGAYSDNSPRFPDSINSDEPDDEDERKQANPRFQINDQRRHIDICAFSACRVSVSPQDDHYLGSLRAFGHFYKLSWNNIWRMLHAMMPVSMETYLDYVINGHQDMKDYIFRNNLVKCRECFDNHNKNNTPKRRLGDKTAVAFLDRKACLACLQLLEKVDSLVLPPAIHDIFVV